MDIKHLQYFIEVTKFNSFSKAADQLFITQPTISKMIKNLETELQVELFDRSRKQIVLTEAGHVLLKQAKLVTQAFRNLEAEIDNVLELKTGHLRIGLPPIFDAHVFLRAAGLFHKRYPGITYQLLEEGSKTIEEAVAQNELDAGVVVLPTQTDKFHFFAFMEEDLRLILPGNHPLAHREQIELQELAAESFILFNKDFALNDRIITSCRSAGFDPKIVSESSQWTFIEEMVASNLGVSLLPESICRHLGSHVRSVKVTHPSLKWELAIIWRKHQYISYAAKEWLAFTKAFFSSQL